MKHIEKAQSVRHIYKRHGNEKTEKSRGQIAIKQSDIEMIPDIVGNYTFAIKNIKYKGAGSTVYAKHGKESTYIYIEKRNEKIGHTYPLVCSTLKTGKTKNTVLKILANNKNYDVSHAEIHGRGSGNFPNTTSTMSSRTAAISINPSVDASLSPVSAKKSHSRSETSKMQPKGWV
jgi:hypothetical protein